MHPHTHTHDERAVILIKSSVLGVIILPRVHLTPLKWSGVIWLDAPH